MKLAMSATGVPSSFSAAVEANVLLSMVAAGAKDVTFDVAPDSGMVMFSGIFTTRAHDFGSAMQEVYDVCTLAFLETDCPLEWVSFWGMAVPDFKVLSGV